MPGDRGKPDEQDALRREVEALRARVADLQRAAARHEETDDVSLAEREELLREFERVAHLGTWTWDVGTGRVTWSDEMYRILGVEQGAITPSVDAFFAAVHPDDREHAQAATEKSLKDGVLPLVDCRVIRPDGSIRHTTSSSSMLFDAEGVPRRVVGGVLDVTEQIRMREDLEQTRKMQAVGRLAAGIAHDFNNLLTVVTANLEILGEREGPSPELDQSMQALDSAANLTRRLLAFGRQAPLSLAVLDPNELVRSTTELMQRLVGDEVSLEIALAPELPRVRVDPLEIERALVNLVVNARDAMPRGGVVRIATRVDREGEEHRVELSVADEGSGIDEADLPHIFEPFFTTRDQAGGTGLGLATVLGTAEQHGGSVRVEARPGGGTVFTIVLPAASGTHAEGGPADAGPKGPQTRSLQILVVDDDPGVASVTRRILVRHGHQVDLATEPEEALQIWSDHGADIDLVLCDVVMAHMRGPELVERMAERGPEPRVLFMTGYSEQTTQGELGHPLITKPFTTAGLLRAVRTATR